jgi:acetyl esterase/lipase
MKHTHLCCSGILLPLMILCSPAMLAPGAAPSIRINPDDLDLDAWQPDERVAYKKVDGIDLPMTIFLPPGAKVNKEKRPAILCIHGGAWSGWKGGDVQTWDGSVFLPHARYFAARGAVAVTISYRNVPRPGKAQEAFEKGPSLFDLLADCRSAVRYLRKNADRLGIDPKRIAVIGDSAGGHLAACLGTIDRFDNPGDDTSVSALANLTIPCNPITDLTDPKWISFVPETPRAWEAGKPLSREARAKAISPLWNITPAAAPSLAMHGTADSIVDPRHSTDYQARMKEAGVRCDLFMLPNAGHAFILFGYRSSGAEFLECMKTIDQFLVSAGYLNGEAVIDIPAPQGSVARIACDRISNGRIPGDTKAALVAPDAAKPGVTKAEIVADAQRGSVLQVSKGKEGLALSVGCPAGRGGSVAVWILPGKPGGTLFKRGTGGGTGTGCMLTMGNTGAITLSVARTTLTAQLPPLTAWTHLAFSIGPDKATLYVNGKTASEVPLKNPVLIGPRVSIAEDYAGLISDVRVFDDAITDEDVAKLAASSRP